MVTACVLLVVIGVLGAFDIAWFHTYKCRLLERRESRTEAWIHVARGFVYALQFALVPNFHFAGAWYLAFVLLFVADAGIAFADVAIEPASRRSQGGLPAGEYLMHIVLSVLVGAYLHALATDTLSWMKLPAAITFAPIDLPLALRVALVLLGVGSAVVALVEAVSLIELALPRPRPLHVAVRLRAPMAELWAVTQDHRLHPTWDHRFSRITMLGDRIETGTSMLYEKRVLGMTIRGFGRYKLHRPLAQSTFEFWSDDARSIIRRGVGLWRYLPQADGTIEFKTSYTYDVRWGLPGRLFDRCIFRRLLQWETERSFRRLARAHFDGGASRVAGARGRKPEPLDDSGHFSRREDLRRRTEQTRPVAV